MTGTSNTRQGNKEGRIRKTMRPYHRLNHSCCNATEDAEFLTVVSNPGLSTENINKHTVLGGSYKGKNTMQVLNEISQSPNFNGHLVFWFLDNDFDFMKYFHDYYESMTEAVEEYFKMLHILLEGLSLHYERIYLVTAPFRQSDFIETIINNKTYFPFAIRKAFNNELRSQFQKSKITIQNIPATLINLDEIWPEHTTCVPHYYCFREENGKKIHYNRFEYKKFLDLLHCTLKQYGGLQPRETNLPSPSKNFQVDSQSTDPNIPSDPIPPLPACRPKTSNFVDPIPMGNPSHYQTPAQQPRTILTSRNRLTRTQQPPPSTRLPQQHQNLTLNWLVHKQRKNVNGEKRTHSEF